MVRNVQCIQISRLMNKSQLTVSDKIAYIFCIKKNMSLSDLIKRDNQQQSTIEIKVEPKKQEAMVDVEQKKEKIDPPKKKEDKNV